jgi:hypothetical protein
MSPPARRSSWMSTPQYSNLTSHLPLSPPVLPQNKSSRMLSHHHITSQTGQHSQLRLWLELTGAAGWPAIPQTARRYHPERSSAPAVPVQAPAPGPLNPAHPPTKLTPRRVVVHSFSIRILLSNSPCLSIGWVWHGNNKRGVQEHGQNDG